MKPCAATAIDSRDRFRVADSTGDRILARVRQFIPRSLGSQIAVALALITLIAILSLGFYVDRSMRQANLDEIQVRLEAEARLIGRGLAPALNSGADMAVIQEQVRAFGTDTETRITIIKEDGTVVGDSLADPETMNNHLDRPEIAKAFETGHGVAQRGSGTVDESFLYVAVIIPEAPEFVSEVAMPMTDIDAANDALRQRIIVAGLISAGAATLLGIFVARRISSSLAELEAGVVRMAAGDLGSEITPPSTRELEALAESFNVMSSKLEESFAENRRARMRWASAFASLSDGLILVNSQEIVTALNPAAARLLETDLEWAVDQPFVLVVRDHELTSLLREALRRQETRRTVIEFTRGDRTIEATAGPVAGFNEPYAVVTLRDVTELRKLESIRREFVANVSHELRTPIASIKAMVETLEAGAIEDPDLTNDFLNRMVGESDRLAALVDDLLDLGRLESGRVSLHPEPLNPADLLNGAAERLRPQTERARLTLEASIPEGLPEVMADRGRIEQVILNLVHNAIKFTPSGGTIRVTARSRGSELVVTVEDTGSGIAPVELGRLFERFYKVDRSRRSEGTGLGLAIAKHIVQAHEGTIWVESEPGHGSRFFFTLPFASAMPQSIEPAAFTDDHLDVE